MCLVLMNGYMMPEHVFVIAYILTTRHSFADWPEVTSEPECWAQAHRPRLRSGWFEVSLYEGLDVLHGVSLYVHQGSSGDRSTLFFFPSWAQDPLMNKH